MTNVEVLELALGTLTAKDVIETRITFACDCQIVYGLTVEDIDEAMLVKPCSQHAHMFE